MERHSVHATDRRRVSHDADRTKFRSADRDATPTADGNDLRRAHYALSRSAREDVSDALVVLGAVRDLPDHRLRRIPMGIPVSDTEPNAIIFASDGPDGALRTLSDRLASVGVVVTIVDELATAVELAQRHEEAPAI